MTRDFLRAPLGKIGSPVCRIGLSATYRPGRQTVFKALDEGLNYFLYFGFDNHMTSVLRETVPQRRGQYVLATGAYNLIWGDQNLSRNGLFPASPGAHPGRGELLPNPLDLLPPPAARISQGGTPPDCRHVLPLCALQPRGPRMYDGAGQPDAVRAEPRRDPAGTAPRGGHAVYAQFRRSGLREQVVLHVTIVGRLRGK